MRWIIALAALFGTVLILAAVAPLPGATWRLAEYSQWLGSDAFPAWLRALVGGVLLTVAVLLWIAFKRRQIVESSDYWGERNQLEISVIANVSAGRESTAMPINSDPANSRLRELKDAIEQGTLRAALRDGKVDMWARVTLGAFKDYAVTSNKPYWNQVLWRWQTRQKQAASLANTFSASLSVRDAVYELAPQAVPDIDAFNKAIRLLDTTTLRVLNEHAITLPEVGIQTRLDRSVTDILIRTEIGDRKVADQRGHEKSVARIRARGPMWAEVFKAILWLIVGGILTLGGQQVF